MNALLSNEQSYSPFEEEEDISIEITAGDKFAVSVIGLIAGSALLLGIWSGVVLFNGITNNGGPLKYFIILLQMLGIL